MELPYGQMGERARRGSCSASCAAARRSMPERGSNPRRAALARLGAGRGPASAAITSMNRKHSRRKTMTTVHCDRGRARWPRRASRGHGCGADRPDPVVPRRRQRGGTQDPQPDHRRLQRQSQSRLEGLDRAVPAGRLQRLRDRRGARRQAARHPRRRRPDHAQLGLGRLSCSRSPSTRAKLDGFLPGPIGRGTASSTRSASGTRPIAMFARKSILEKYDIRIPTLDKPWTGGRVRRRACDAQGLAASSTIRSTSAWPGHGRMVSLRLLAVPAELRRRHRRPLRPTSPPKAR